MFEAAVAAPDSLAAHLQQGEEVECEDFMYVADRAHEAVAGKHIEGTSAPYPDPGDGWDFDDESEMSGRYPELWKKFGW